MPNKKAHSLPIDRETFPGIALAIHPASIATINSALEQIKAGADLSAVSLDDGKFIAMRCEDWQILYSAWRHVVDFNQLFADANRAMEEMTKDIQL